jgi:hypothetical protein
MNDFSFYFSIGWEHILSAEALDHVLFIAALAAIYMLKDWKQVFILITAFTVGHTITLVLSAKEWVTIDSGLVELLVPCTIAITAMTNLFQKQFTPKAIQVNYFLALFFGLIHGLAFANTLRMILATNQSFAPSMFSFSLGLETGQVVIVLAILLLSQLFIGGLKVERRHWVIFLSAAVLSLSLQMALERWPGHNDKEAFIGPTETPAAQPARLFWSTGYTALIDRQWRRSVQQQIMDWAMACQPYEKTNSVKNTNNI